MPYQYSKFFTTMTTYGPWKIAVIIKNILMFKETWQRGGFSGVFA
jgi:hypothetical protein